MLNLVGIGKHFIYPVPSGVVNSGDVVLVGGLIGVASEGGAFATGDSVQVFLDGVYTVPLKAGDVPTLGQKLYWDTVNVWATVTAGALKVLGGAWVASVGGDTTVAVKLIGTIQ